MSDELTWADNRHVYEDMHPNLPVLESGEYVTQCELLCFSDRGVIVLCMEIIRTKSRVRQGRSHTLLPNDVLALLGREEMGSFWSIDHDLKEQL